MFTGKTVFAQLMSFIPRRDFNACVARYKGDYRTRNLSCYDQFLVMCLAQYASKNSLRDIEASLIAVEHKLYHSGISYAVPQKHKIYTSVSGCRMRKIKSGLEALDFVLDSTVLNLSFIYDNYILVGAVGPFKGFFAAGFVDGHCGEVFGFELHKFFRADFFATHNIDVVDIDICCLACF